MQFDSKAYGNEVDELLALDGGGWRMMPLAHGKSSSSEAAKRLKAAGATALFPGARAPEAALAGLWLYFSCLEESHRVSQEIHTSDGSFWHGIMHRQEPDAGNSGYWFRRVGKHAVFPDLRDAADAIVERAGENVFSVGSAWDPFAFIGFCEIARLKPGSTVERVAMEIQRAEWQLLFDYCARPRK